VDLLKCVPGSFSETSDDRNQVIRVKVEEENSSVSAFTEREDEHEVSCICLYIVSLFFKYPVFLVVFLTSSLMD
jgi:hypothetical protein